MKQKYYVKFETGSPWSFDAGWYETIEQAYEYAKEKGYEIYSVGRFQGAVDRTGFKPHYNHALGMHIETKGQFNAELKKRGMFEVGTEKFNPEEINRKIAADNRKPLFNDALVDEFRQRGHTLDDNLVETLKKESKELGIKSTSNVTKKTG